MTTKNTITLNGVEIELTAEQTEQIRQAFLEPKYKMCSSYDLVEGKPRCYSNGLMVCDCNGDKNNCSFYPPQKEWRRKPQDHEKYRYIDNDGYIMNDSYNEYDEDCDRYKFGNYFPCEDFSKAEVEEINLAQELNRLLRIYAHYRNDVPSKEDWEDSSILKHFVSFSWEVKKWDTDVTYSWQDEATAYFKTSEIAEQAIKDVVEPFMAAHPEFVG